MHVMVIADDGDQVLVRVDDLAIEQAVVQLEFQNYAYSQSGDLDSITLTAKRARELGRALILAAQTIEFEQQTRMCHSTQMERLGIRFVRPAGASWFETFSNAIAYCSMKIAPFTQDRHYSMRKSASADLRGSRLEGLILS